jgi:magnesium transporter
VTDSGRNPETEPREAEETDPLFEHAREILDTARQALATNDVQRVESVVENEHAADIAHLLEQLYPEERRLFVEITRHILDPETLSYLDETVREEVLEFLTPKEVAAAVVELDSDDAVDILEDLDDEQKEKILASIPPEERAILEAGLTYPEESAGRLMQRELVAAPSYWTVGECIDFLRAAKELPDDFYDLFLVDPAHKPVGSVPLSRAMRNRRNVKLEDIMETDLRVIPAEMDQEAVAHLFRQYALVSAPVVDEAGRLVGVITVDDVVHVIDEEAEDDLMKLGGVKEDDLYRAAVDTARSRFTWLGINLGTAFLASFVISIFESTIERVVALAVLMPIVASMGGNAGTQTLTVAVRALAMKDLTDANAWRFVGKELIVGSFNGVIFAVLVGAVAGFWFESLEIGIVIGAAMVVNLLVAGLAGTLIPLGLDKLKIDPAVASGVFLTTMTDVIGFLAFLGLATLFLL